MKRFLCFLAIILIGQVISWIVDGEMVRTFQIGLLTGWLSEWYLAATK